MKPTVSIVYTELHVLQSIEKILNEAGINTYIYYTSEEALGWAGERHPDLYLINYKNAKLDGFEFFQELKERNSHYEDRETKAVFISSHERIESECYKFGSLDFIQVPFDPKELVYKIKRALINAKISRV